LFRSRDDDATAGGQFVSRSIGPRAKVFNFTASSGGVFSRVAELASANFVTTQTATS
jgi:hypothetical protein